MSENDESRGSRPRLPTKRKEQHPGASVLDISTSPGAEGPWKSSTTTWPDFLLTLGEPADHKECGGYVFGRLKYSRRNRDSVLSRSAVTLDADYAAPDLIDRVRALGYTAAWYTTWRHTPEAPRYRLIFPAARSMTPAEYRATAGALMDLLGRESMDETADQPERFMWRPSSQDRSSYDHGSMNGALLPAVLTAPELPSAERTPAALDTYIDDSPERQEPGIHPYAEAAISRELARLRAMWPEEDGWNGEPWNTTTFAVACNLIEFANSNWSGYTLEQAHDHLLELAPRDEKFGDREIETCWESAIQKVGRNGRPCRDGEQPTASGMTPAGGWGPLDLSAYLDGTYEPLEAKLLRRNDGVALLYPGMTHSLHGESESGKSMIAQYEAVQQMQAGNAVIYVDYEADAGSVIERMLLMGATRDQISTLLTYMNPELDPDHDDDTRAAFDALLKRRYTLAVLDGVNEALTQSPARDRSTSGLGGNDDITAWQARLPRRIASRTGAAVVLIDHVAKGEGAGRFAIGGQAKMAALTGAAYVVRPSNPIGKGLTGTVELWVGKDRHGYVRQHANPDFKADRLQHVATVIVDGVNGLTLDLVSPPMRPAAIDQTREMQDRVVEFLRDLADDHPGLSVNAIKNGVSGKDAQIAEALNALVDRGVVAARFRGQSKLHRLAAKQA